MGDFYDTFLAEPIPTRKKYRKPKFFKIDKCSRKGRRGKMKGKGKSPWGDWHNEIYSKTERIAKDYNDKKKNLRETVLTLTDTLITLYEDMPPDTLLGKEDKVADLFEFVAGRLESFKDRYRRYD